MTKDPRQAPGGEAPGVDGLAYEELVEQLDGVVRQLEAGELSLEESLRAFERGVVLAQAAERRLDAAEQRVEMLLQGDRVAPLPGVEAEAPGTQRQAAPAEDDDVPF